MANNCFSTIIIYGKDCTEEVNVRNFKEKIEEILDKKIQDPKNRKYYDFPFITEGFGIDEQDAEDIPTRGEIDNIEDIEFHVIRGVRRPTVDFSTITAWIPYMKFWRSILAKYNQDHGCHLDFLCYGIEQACEVFINNDTESDIFRDHYYLELRDDLDEKYILECCENELSTKAELCDFLNWLYTGRMLKRLLNREATENEIDDNLMRPIQESMTLLEMMNRFEDDDLDLYIYEFDDSDE